MFNLVPWKNRHNGNLKVQEDRGAEDLPISQIREEFNMLMDRFFKNSLAGRWPAVDMWDWSRGSWNIDLEDCGKEYVFQAEVPGFEPTDFDVKISGNTLVLRAENRKEKKGRRRASYHHGEYSQTVTLPEDINVDGIQARYHSGVMEVHLPKSENAQVKRIEVKTGA